MAFGYVVSALERSELANNAPSRDQIRESLLALQDRTRVFPSPRPPRTALGVPVPGTQGPTTRPNGTAGSRLIGQWIGPEPRVTRVVQPIGTGNAFNTRAVWVYGLTDEEVARSLPTDATKRQFADNLAHDAFDELEEHAGVQNPSRSNWTVSVTGYNPLVNGAPEWWESGGASRDARWVDTFPPLVRAPFPDDNPSGPNGLHPNPQGTDWLAWGLALAGVTVAGIALVQFGPALASWVPTKSKPAKTENPRRRR